MPASRPPANLQAVADAAGVHRSTASRALNPSTTHLVAGAVAHRIQNIARELGYRADPLAAGLRTRRSRMVGVVLPDMTNPVFGPILSGIEAELASRGYWAIVANAHGDAARQVAVVEELMHRRVEGLILATAHAQDVALTRCVEAGMATVLVNRAESKQRVPAVVSDNALGLRLAVAHLVQLGHRAIAHLGGPQNLSTGQLRRQGYEAAMCEAGLELGPIVFAQDYTREAGRRATQELFAKNRFTAIAAANDLLALGAYQEIFARKLVCPGDISVTGHNDMPLVDMVDPPLTTVRISHEELGRQAASFLFEAMQEPGARPIIRTVAPCLVLRGSTAPPRD